MTTGMRSVVIRERHSEREALGERHLERGTRREELGERNLERGTHRERGNQKEAVQERQS